MNRFNTVYVGAIGVALLASISLAGCASSRAAHTDLAPRTLAEVLSSASRTPVATGKPSIALVLGGGGLRGFAHLGVLRALDEAGIEPDIVVGTSAGAVVGAAYASGLPARQIESIAREVKLSSLIDFTFSKSGLMRGDHIASWVNTMTSNMPMEKFPRRFAAVATDLPCRHPQRCQGPRFLSPTRMDTWWMAVSAAWCPCALHVPWAPTS
jgi:NTE family protein